MLALPDLGPKTLAMKAQAMRSRPENAKTNTAPEIETGETHDDELPEDETEGLGIDQEDEEDELDESALQAADDDRWDVFLLDDDGEWMPEQSDFWIPD